MNWIDNFLQRLKLTPKYFILLYFLTIGYFINAFWQQRIWSCIVFLTLFYALFLIFYWLGLLSARTAVAGCIMSILYFLIIPLIACKYYFSDNESFEVDREVLENERKIATKSLNSYYNITRLIHDTSAISSLISYHGINLDKNIDELLNKDITVDTVVLNVTKTPLVESRHPAYHYNVKVFGKNSRDSVTLFYEAPPPGGSFEKFSSIFKDVLNNNNRFNQENITKYRRQELLIKGGAFWTHQSLLPYIITSQNIKPKTRAANYLYFIHEKLFWGILLTFILGIILSKTIERPS